MPPGDSAPSSSKSIEIRVHGRGGQGGVTCAKILASVYAQLGKSVQTFGDYAGERSGSPVRAYTRVDDNLVTNRNKVYEPDHLVVLDPSLLKGDVVTGLKSGGTLLLNTPNGLDGFKNKFQEFGLATVDATEIARRHKIGTRSLIIVNTAIAGAFCKLQGLSLELLEQTYTSLGLLDNLPAAKEAYEAVQIRAATSQGVAAPKAAAAPARAEVAPLTEHLESPPTNLKTGSWSSQRPMYVDRLAPCTAHCPAGIDAVGFVRTVGTDGEAAAAAILGQTNPLPGVCGRICPAPCMDGCNRGGFDGAINIRGLERWIADHAQVVPEKVEPAADRKQVAIVGGGPSGLSAAYTVALAGHSATIFDREPQLGGTLRASVPEYLLPRAVLDKEIEAILSLGVETRLGEALTNEGIAALAGDFDAVILAANMGRPVKPDLEGIELAGVEQANEFLRRHHQSGDGKISGHVLVVGDGFSALDAARVALRAGAERVTLAVERSESDIPGMWAAREGLRQAKEEGVTILARKRLSGLSGKDRVEVVELADLGQGGSLDTGPTILEVDHVLLAPGRVENMAGLPKGWRLEGEEIHLGNGQKPLFAAGELADGNGSVAHAIGSGRRAAGLALQALDQKIDLFVPADPEKAVKLDDLLLDRFKEAPPTLDVLRPAKTRVADFDEANLGMKSAGEESERCFSCGRCNHCDTCLVYCPEGIVRRTPKGGFAVNFSYCKGCGICVQECARSAMEMKEI